MNKLDQDLRTACASEAARDFHECFLEEATTGRIRWTAKGRAVFGAQFARAGIDIRHIRTREELRTACRRSERVFVDDLRSMVKGHTELERMLDAVWPST